MRATDRAREAFTELSCSSSEGLADFADRTLPAALDFADAVEAARSAHGFSEIDEIECLDRICDAHAAFLAQLDRATGGADV